MRRSVFSQVVFSKWFCLALVVVVTGWQPLCVRWLVNTGLLYFLQAHGCDPARFFCELEAPSLPVLWQGNQDLLNQAGRFLEAAWRLQPGDKTIPLQLAAVRFSLGERQSLPSLAAQPESFSPGRSPLTAENRYEYHLLQGQRLTQDGEWESAVDHFRRAMSMQPEFILLEDDQGLYQALAQQQKELAEDTNLRALYFAGKYFALAGQWKEALPLLLTVLASDEAGQLDVKELQMVWLYLGHVYAASGEFDAAKAAYQRALEPSSELREAYLALIILLQKEGLAGEAQQTSEQLANLGPNFLLGVHTSGYSLDNPAALPNQWKLIGYDLDEQLLEVSTALNLILWWQIPSAAQPAEDMVHIGDYWLQRKTVRNLFANAGFEWGIDEKGLPIGGYREFYGAPQGDLSVREDFRDGASTHVLTAKNSAANQYVALASRLFPVNPQSYYLMAGWWYDQDRFAKIGRNCVNPFYISAYDPARPRNSWTYAAELSAPFAGSTPGFCEILVSNINSTMPAEWDNVIWARIVAPLP